MIVRVFCRRASASGRPRGLRLKELPRSGFVLGDEIKVGGQCEMDGGAAVQLGFHPDLAAVRHHDAFCD